MVQAGGATGEYEIVSYTVPSGYRFILKTVIVGANPVTQSTTELYMGYAFLRVNSTDVRAIEARGMDGDICGIYGSRLGAALIAFLAGAGWALTIPDGAEYGAGTVLKVVANVTSTTVASRWRGTLIGEEIALPITKTVTAKDFPMAFLPKPVKADELRSKVEGATITVVSKDFPLVVKEKNKQAELTSKFE